MLTRWARRSSWAAIRAASAFLDATGSADAGRATIVLKVPNGTMSARTRAAQRAVLRITTGDSIDGRARFGESPGAGRTVFGMANDFRIEHDSLGEVKVPKKAKWAAQTQRAVENFPISGLTIDPL